jgi:hypothetical protein
MALQDSIKYKSDEITRYKGLSGALEEAEIIPSNQKIKNFMSNLISQSTEQENRLETMAKNIRCKFIMKKS